jgi:hypothetical protein
VSTPTPVSTPTQASTSVAPAAAGESASGTGGPTVATTPLVPLPPTA